MMMSKNGDVERTYIRVCSSSRRVGPMLRCCVADCLYWSPKCRTLYADSEALNSHYGHCCSLSQPNQSWWLLTQWLHLARRILLTRTTFQRVGRCDLSQANGTTSITTLAPQPGLTQRILLTKTAFQRVGRCDSPQQADASTLITTLAPQPGLTPTCLNALLGSALCPAAGKCASLQKGYFISSTMLRR